MAEYEARTSARKRCAGICLALATASCLTFGFLTSQCAAPVALSVVGAILLFRWIAPAAYPEHEEVDSGGDEETWEAWETYETGESSESRETWEEDQGHFTSPALARQHPRADERTTYREASTLRSSSISGSVTASAATQGGLMEAELMALATAGATALVQQMVVDSWGQARDRMVSFFSHPRVGEGDQAEGELEASRRELTTAMNDGDEQTALDVEAEWRMRLRRTLLANPAAAPELQAAIEAMALPRNEQQVADVHNSISGGVQHGPVLQAGNVGSLNFGTSSGQA